MARERSTYVLTIEGQATHGNQVLSALESADHIAADVRRAFEDAGAAEPGDVFSCRLLRYSQRVGLVDKVLECILGKC